jgi:hypothetical protein
LPFLAATSKGIDPGVLPHIAAIAAKPAKLDIIAMPVVAALEDEDELVLTAVQ